MFKIMLLFIAAVTVNAAQYAPLPVKVGTSQLSPTSTFVAANNIVTNEVICVRVDMQRDTTSQKSVYWCDCELKVLDKNGNIIYFASSVWRDRSYHSDSGVIDNNVKIYYYTSGANTNGVCAKPKKLLVQSGAADYSSGNSISSVEGLSLGVSPVGRYTMPLSITTVEFYPNLSGTLNGVAIREIFLNPENSVIVSRKNSIELERDYSNQIRVWRPAIPQYYRTLP